MKDQPSDAVLRAGYTTTAMAAQHHRAKLSYEAEERIGNPPAGGLKAEQDNWTSDLYRDEPNHTVSICAVDSAHFPLPIPQGFPVPDRLLYFVGDGDQEEVFLLGGFATPTDGQPPLNIEKPSEI